MGYTQEERLRWAGRIFRVCKLLSDQGIDVVCCSIAMFDTVRRWNRENIPNYKEIYIRVKKETLIRRNQKGLYTSGSNVVGVDLPFDEPKSPDLILQNDGDRTPLELVEEVERIFYPNQICSTQPSPFAQYVATLVEPGKTLIDLGCGNGRDSLFFAKQGMQVVAIDLSRSAIDQLNQQPVENARFVCGDFIASDVHQPDSYDYAYSRFTIHAINQKQETMLLQTMFRALKPGGKFFIEVRSVNDPLYGKGKAVEPVHCSG